MGEILDKENATNPIPESTTPDGFGKGVNDYLNHFITIADAKAGALLAANFVLLGGVINLKVCCCNFILIIITGAVSILSIIFCCIVLYPRLPKVGKGLIFWGNIKSFNTANEYLIETGKLDNKQVEIEYATQNWLVSQVLSNKNYYVRFAIWTFCISLVILVVTYFITKF